MEDNQSQVSTGDTLSLFWQFTKKYRGYFWYATIMSVVSAIIADVLPAAIVASAFDKLQTLYSHHKHITFKEMSSYFYLYLAVTIASLVSWRGQAYSAWKYMTMTEKDLYDHMFDHLQNMDSSFHANRFGGSLVSQVNKFISAYDGFMGNFNWNILNGIAAFIASLAILFFTSFIYALVFLFVALIYFAVMYRQMKKQVPYNRAVSNSESKTTAKLADNITNVSTVRAFAGEAYERKLFSRQTVETRTKNLQLMKVQLTNEIYSQTGTSLVEILAFGLGIVSIVYFHAPVGALYLTITYTLDLSQRLWNFMFVLKNLNKQFGDAAGMTEILAMDSGIKDPEKPEKSKINRGEVNFKNVTFKYPESKKPLFSGLDLKIKPGEKVGLVGHSGGGKTTITQLLLRFMDINSGTISIDGQDITKIKQTDLREEIAYVSQDTILFHRTLAENIAYGSLDATQEVIEGVAKMANAHEFISNLPDGYNTLVGERGVKLSGGQRQRVVIARAMLKNAPILVLDEATSALDSESEILIQQALWKLMNNRTAIVIAHRLSTIVEMDRIVVLENGKIAEQGSHKELLRLGAVYAKLWDHQSGGFMEE